jgi:hypothetical protein
VDGVAEYIFLDGDQGPSEEEEKRLFKRENGENKTTAFNLLLDLRFGAEHKTGTQEKCKKLASGSLVCCSFGTTVPGRRSEASSVDSESLSKSQTALDLWKPERRLGDEVRLTCPTSEVTGELLVPQRCLTSERIRQAFNLPNTPDIILEFTTTPGGWVECVFVEHQGPSQNEILVSSNGAYSVLADLGNSDGERSCIFF